MPLANAEFVQGMRHVSQEENQMRRQDAQVLPLHKLQDRVYLHASGEEAESSQRVWRRDFMQVAFEGTR